jgi:radical SAM-linked protein
MADPKLFRLRVKYVKAGRLALLSHLEITRALEREVRRAGLPFAVSCGFSPHMKISFGAALPVGVGGTQEFFDLYLTRYVAPEAALGALQAKSARDLMPFEAAYVEHALPAASVGMPLSSYELTFTHPAQGVCVPETIEVTRKKKTKVLQVAEFLAAPVELAEGGTCVTFALEAKATGSMRVDVFSRELLVALKGDRLIDAAAKIESITRVSQKSSN